MMIQKVLDVMQFQQATALMLFTEVIGQIP